MELIKTGIEPAGGSVADFVAFTKTERQRLSELAAKIKVTKKAGAASLGLAVDPFATGTISVSP